MKSFVFLFFGGAILLYVVVVVAAAAIILKLNSNCIWFFARFACINMFVCVQFVIFPLFFSSCQFSQCDRSWEKWNDCNVLAQTQKIEEEKINKLQHLITNSGISCFLYVLYTFAIVATRKQRIVNKVRKTHYVWC